MSAPVKPQERRTRALPDPELVSLIGDPSGPYAGSPPGWWDQYGGAVAGGVVHLPGPTHPPNSRHPDDCPNCVPMRGNSCGA